MLKLVGGRKEVTSFEDKVGVSALIIEISALKAKISAPRARISVPMVSIHPCSHSYIQSTCIRIFNL